MSEKECLYQMMLGIFKEADKKQETITSLCKRYGISRKWFYQWKKRRDKEEVKAYDSEDNLIGDEGLRLKIRSAMWAFKINLRLLNRY